MVTLPIPADHPAFAGHFPGHPIVPGVVLLDLAQAAIEAEQGLQLGGLAMAKFLRPVGPAEVVALRHEVTPTGVRFSLHVGEHTVANGRFNLRP